MSYHTYIEESTISSSIDSMEEAEIYQPNDEVITITIDPSLEKDNDQASSKTISSPASKFVTQDVIHLPSIHISEEPGPVEEYASSPTKKAVLFDTVTVYHFNRSQGFTSIPSQGGSTLGMKRRHFLRRKLSVDLFEEVRRRSRREILLKIKFDKDKTDDCDQLLCNSTSSSTSSSSNTTTSDSDEESISDYSDISDSELETDGFVFCQPIGVKLRRSLLRASGVGRIDPNEKKECRVIRESRDRSGCNCVNQCIPGLCECTILGVNCHVDRASFPCGCISNGCRNPLGRTEFDVKRVKQHMFDTLFKVGVG